MQEAEVMSIATSFSVPRAARALHRPFVLCADDDPSCREALSTLLEMWCYDVLAVENGSELLEALGETLEFGARRADLIVTDVWMPGFHGVQVAEELRADGWAQPILVMSAFVTPEVRTRIERLDGCELLRKPLSASLLRETLQQMLRHGGSRVTRSIACNHEGSALAVLEPGGGHAGHERAARNGDQGTRGDRSHVRYPQDLPTRVG